MEQNTNFKVGDRVQLKCSQANSWPSLGHFWPDSVFVVKILKITPKRFLVQALGSCESGSDSEEEETYKETASNCPPVYVKDVVEII